MNQIMLLTARAQLLGGQAPPTLATRRGWKPRAPLPQLFVASLADSCWSDRRIRLPWQIFAELRQRALRPLARPCRQPEAFWRGWALRSLDGTQFSLTNPLQINGAVQKAKSRRGRAAFAKLAIGALLEIGLHNPLAAVIGRQGQSEWERAQKSSQWLFIFDRLAVWRTSERNDSDRFLAWADLPANVRPCRFFMSANAARLAVAGRGRCG